ncbi:MAG: hypothetical protein WC856_00190 [Methylococcaceae bacterium]|jgi:hypothetical protein
MAIYIAVPLTPTSSALNDAVVRSIASASDRYQLQSDRGWLIKFDGTSVELSNHIGLTGQAQGDISPIGSAIIVPVSAYYGRGPTDMWEWLKTRLEQ